jgi:hypothetical protein
MNKALNLLLFWAATKAKIPERFLGSLVTNTDFWDYVPPAVTYNSNLTCDQCIRSSYVFCLQGPEHLRVHKREQMPLTKCCADSTCLEASSSLWNCTDRYANPIMSRYVCPFITGHCGFSDQIIMNTTGEKATIRMNLPGASVCMYQLRAKCGLPSFEPNITSDIVDIQYIQYDD